MYYISGMIYFIIIGILVFINIGYIVVRKYRKKKELNKRKKYEEEIRGQIKDLRKSSLASKEHLTFLEKELININHLCIFEEVLLTLKEENAHQVEEYCKSIRDAVHNLAVFYRKKRSMQKAYFAHVLSVFPEMLFENDDAINYAMMHFVLDDSIYCRENAMLFFYHKSSEKLVVNSLKKISRRHLYYSPKLLADDLLSFTGDHHKLADLLLYEFSHFSGNFQIAIINYLRFSKESRAEEIYDIYQDKKYSKEVRLAIIRYFGTHKNKIFLDELMQIMKDKNAKNFEYRLVAACTLARYDVKAVRNILIESLRDKSWYVRKNSAISLSKMSLTEEEKETILSLDDKYAKEMFHYIWQDMGNGKIFVRKAGKE